ncbi:acyltransferase [Clostridium hydrogeniformans]|uniref:acyltransferase n=1 Tax=Clostridium hydrogeniformans TaxID=349933 RepID=UPI000485C314|nr:acyltransferase [Clostridium hydrogeniformans]
MINIISFIISKIKKEKYELDRNIKIGYLLSLIINKVISLLRGYKSKIFIKKCGKNFFVEKGVIIKYKNNINIGNGVTIKSYCYIDALSRNGLVIGNNCSIGNYSRIICTGSLKFLGYGIKIGNNFGCGEWCFFGAAGGITIGNDVIMGQNVRFHSENHKFKDISIPIRNQGVINKGIYISDDCWIGSGVVFLDGVKVGKGCVIGANTLVNKNIPDYSIAVGNPVKIIRSRMEEVK